MQRALKVPGQALGGALRSQMEQATGTSLAGVELHTGSLAADGAAAVGAPAFTLGRHVAFGASAFEPQSERGRRLLVHELAHAAASPQATDSATPRARRLGGAAEPAEHVAQSVALGRSVVASPGRDEPGVVRRAPPAQPAPDDVGARASRDASCRILFVKGRAELADAKAFDRCMKAARRELAAAGSGAEILLYGFASEEGTPDFNQKLSEDRAATILRLFASGGIERARMRKFAYGASRTYADVAQNRRVEVVVLRQQQMPTGDEVKGKPPTPVPFEKKLDQPPASPRYMFQASMLAAQKIGLPTKYLNEVMAVYDFKEVEATDDNLTDPLLNNIQFRPGVLSSNFDPTNPAMSPDFSTIYHESLHAYIEDVMSDVEPFASLRAAATEHYRGAPVGDEGKATTDPSRVAAEAAAEYVDHRVNTYWKAYSSLAGLASRGKLTEAALAKVRTEYNKAMKRRDGFGYSEEGGDQLHTSRSIPEALRRMLDERVLENKVPDDFDSVKAFADIVEKARANNQLPPAAAAP